MSCKPERRIKDEFCKSFVGEPEGSWGLVHAHQRRRGSKVMYDVWLEQGNPDNPTSFYIAEGEIDAVIIYLQRAKAEIAKHRVKASQLGHRV